PVGDAVLLREPRQIGAEAAEIPGCGRLDVCARVVAHVLAIGLLGGAGRGAGGGVRGVRAAPDGLGEAPRADRDRAPGEQRDERRSEQNEDPVRHHRPPSVSARWRWYSSIATSRASVMAGNSCPVNASSAASERAIGLTGVMSP